MAAARQKDILDEMTRDELVAWIRSSYHQMPRRSEVLYLRWERQSQTLIDDYAAELKAFDGIDLAGRDRLARQYNEAKSPSERLRLLEKMQPYSKAMSEHHARYKRLDARQAKVDKLYEQIDVERQKEARK